MLATRLLTILCGSDGLVPFQSRFRSGYGMDMDAYLFGNDMIKLQKCSLFLLRLWKFQPYWWSATKVGMPNYSISLDL